jgi:hypothetical protein
MLPTTLPRAVRTMLCCAQEMEKTALMMQSDMPATFKDMQTTSREFEVLGKQLNYLINTISRPVIQAPGGLG